MTTPKPLFPGARVALVCAFSAVPAGKPVLMDVQCGHILPTMSLPLGAEAAMDADPRKIEVLR